MKIYRIINIVLSLLLISLLIIMALYFKNGYEIYLDLSFIKLGNSNGNIIYINIGLMLLLWAIYFLVKYIVRKKGILISISLLFIIFLLPFIFLMKDGINRNHSFTLNTSGNKSLLIMGYSKNKDNIIMEYSIYEKHFMCFYEKIGTSNYVDYILSSDVISPLEGEVSKNRFYYYEQNNRIVFMYYDIDGVLITQELVYKH